MQADRILDTIDTHTAGEPTRLIISPLPSGALSGTVASKRDQFAAEHDDVRTFLLGEPRGHRNMFGAVSVEPADPRADCGLFFMDSDGYLDMCGHGTIGAVTALIETGLLPYEPGDGSLVVETPAGLVTTEPVLVDGSVEQVTIENIYASYYDRVEVDIDALGHVPVDIVYAGNFFAMVDADRVGLDLEREPIEALTEYGLAIRRRVNETTTVSNPVTGRDERVDLTEFYQSGEDVDRNVTVFGSGQIDRSPCGTGTCAKMTLLKHRGVLDDDEPYVHESIIGTRFEGRIVGTERIDGVEMNDACVAARAYITGKHTFLRHPEDPIDGFDVSTAGKR